MDEGVELDYLAPERFRQAYTLLEAAGIELSADEWIGYAERLHGRRQGGDAGIVTLGTGGGYIYGLFAFTIDRGGTTAAPLLNCEYFLTGGLPGRFVASQLAKAVEELAKRNRCGEISIALAGPAAINAVMQALPPFDVLDKSYAVTKVVVARRLFAADGASAVTDAAGVAAPSGTPQD